MTTPHRTPYVGTGEDGARRSAEIDREGADTLGRADMDRQYALLESAQRWEQQAYVLERLGGRPTLATIAESGEVGSKEWLAGLALLGLSPTVSADAARFTEWSKESGSYSYEGEGDDRAGTFHPVPRMDWEAWAADVDEPVRGWSSTEWRLFHLVAAITVAERTIQLSGTLDALGSWEGEALDIIVQWASGGNQRERLGRYAAMTTRPAASPR